MLELECVSDTQVVGRAQLWEEGGVWLRLRAELPREIGLCKLWLVRGEKRLLLGTPQPMAQGMVLEKRLSRAMLRQQGLDPPAYLAVLGRKTHPEPESWRPVTEDAPTIPDALVASLVRETGWEWRPWERGVVLRHLWRERTPFPAMPLFCLICPQRQTSGEANLWQLLLYLDLSGNPVLPSR
jgi:hypothetical protein